MLDGTVQNHLHPLGVGCQKGSKIRGFPNKRHQTELHGLTKIDNGRRSLSEPDSGRWRCYAEIRGGFTGGCVSLSTSWDVEGEAIKDGDPKSIDAEVTFTTT